MKYLFITVFMFVISCSVVSVVPQLKDRRLVLCKDKPGLCYYQELCKRDYPWSHKICTFIDNFIDFNNDQERQKLKDMGFTCTSSQRWKQAQQLDGHAIVQ